MESVPIEKCVMAHGSALDNQGQPELAWNLLSPRPALIQPEHKERRDC